MELTYAQTKGIVEALKQVDKLFLRKAELVDALPNLDAIEISDGKYEETLALLQAKHDEYLSSSKAQRPADIYDFFYALNMVVTNDDGFREEPREGTEADLNDVDWLDVFATADSME